MIDDAATVMHACPPPRVHRHPRLCHSCGVCVGLWVRRPRRHDRRPWRHASFRFLFIIVQVFSSGRPPGFFQVFFSSYLTTSLLVYVFAPARVAALSLISSSSPLLLLVPAPPPPSSSPPRACSSFSPFLFSPSSSTNTSPRCCFCSLSPLAVVFCLLSPPPLPRCCFFAYCPPPPSSPPLLGDSRDEAGQILSRKVFASSPHSSSSPPMSFPHNSRQKSNLSSGVRTVRWHALVGNAYTPAFRDK